MYSGEDGEVCVEIGYLGKDISTLKDAQPEKSKAGGLPAWFGEPPVTGDELLCRLCGRDLFLVVQVNAPTHFPRSLCVFGCNRAACSVQPGGWRVIRTQHTQQQQKQSLHPADSHVSDCNRRPTAIKKAGKNTNVTVSGSMPPASPAPADPVVAEPAADAWGVHEEWWDVSGVPVAGDDWGADTGDWGDGAGDRAVESNVAGGDAAYSSTNAIDTLLAEQEKRSLQQMSDRAGISLGVGDGSCVGGVDCVPDNRVRDNRTATVTVDGNSVEQAVREGENEKTASKATKATTVSNEATRSSRTTCSGQFFPAKAVNFSPEPWEKPRASTGGGDKDMERRIRRYREQEEDRGLVAALDEALGLKGVGAGPGSNRSGAESDGSLSGIIGERYERTPARAKAVMRFADRVSRAPQQVLRYAYGGQPLWSASDPPKVDVRPCACGAPRVFEMQLMPALLLRLQVNNFAERPPDQGQNNGPQETTTDHTKKGDATTAEKIPGGGGRTHTAPPLAAGGGAAATSQAAESHGSGDKDLNENSHQRLNNDGVGTVGIGGGDDDGDIGERMPAPSAEEHERLRTWGMDWGVVTVWSCPHSCDLSCEEEVVVQLPV